MSYVKTQWVNNTTPINDTNLNKIEQGIYDNSLVVDAITNTINPTDTETYKTAELTEGQITDVIGVNDIVIKGQTEQDGTPTPSAPVDVNVVSGSNVVNTSNKNVLNLVNGTYSNNGVTAVVKNGKITLNGTAGTGNSLINIPFLLELPAQIQYTLSLNNNFTTSNTSDGLRLSTNDNTRGSFTALNRVKTFTYTEELVDNKITIRLMAGSSVNNGVLKPMIEKASTATAYEPHQGKELPLDLPVENLMELTNSTNTDGGITRVIENGVIKLNGTPESTSYNRTILTFTATKTGQYMLLPYKSSTNSNIRFIYKINDGSFINNDDNLTINLTKNDVVTINLRISSTDKINNFTLKPMLYLGTKANAFYPYGTEPIELCKIGDYQDYFYKSGSKWYLHKEIGKIVLDGITSGKRLNLKHSSITSETKGFYQFYLQNKKITSQGATDCGMSNYFKFVSGGALRAFNNNDSGFWWEENSNYVYAILEETTLENANNWLKNHNTTLYYALEIPTNTEITDTTLISQLEAIYNAPLYEQTNITQTNNDLPMVLDITACKDNINGIKAFIRK